MSPAREQSLLRRLWGAGVKGCLLTVGLYAGVVVVIGFRERVFPPEEQAEKVSYDDCRKIYRFQQRPRSDFLTTYTCTNTYVPGTEQIAWTTCVHLKTEAGVCTEARVYSRWPDENAKK